MNMKELAESFTAQYQIPIAPKPGEIWFYIDLSEVSAHQVPDLLRVLSELGFMPRLAFRQFKEEVSLCALLYYGHRAELLEAPHELYKAEQEVLANLLEEPNAMHFLCGLTRKQTAIAA